MASEHVTDTTGDTFSTDVLEADLPVLVDVWAAWCAPCKQIAPHLDVMAAELDGKLKVVKLDADAHRETVSSYGVTGLPTFLLFKGGEVVDRKIGVGGGPAALRKFVDAHL